MFCALLWIKYGSWYESLRETVRLNPENTELFSQTLKKHPVTIQKSEAIEIFPQPHTCVQAQQRCGPSGWRSSSCWPPVAWKAAKAASDPVPASQLCAAAQEWSASCRHHELYVHETLPCLNPGTAIAGVRVNTRLERAHSTHSFLTAKTTLSRHIQLGKKAVASLTACDVGRLGSKVMMLGFSASSLSRSSVSMSSSSSSSSLSAMAQQKYKHRDLTVRLIRSPKLTTALTLSA